MKNKNILKFAASLILVCSIMSCSNNNNSSTPPASAAGGTFTASIDGQPFVATNVTAVRQVISQSNISLSQMSISGFKIGTITSQFVLQIRENSSNTYSVGKYTDNNTVAFTENSAVINPLFITANPESAGNTIGQIKVTLLDNTAKLISGTFSCILRQYNSQTNVLMGTKIVTNGIFTNVPFITQ